MDNVLLLMVIISIFFCFPPSCLIIYMSMNQTKIAKYIYIRQKDLFQMHFTITIILKITFLQRIACVHDFWFDVTLQKFMKLVIGNN